MRKKLSEIPYLLLTLPIVGAALRVVGRGIQEYSSARSEDSGFPEGVLIQRAVNGIRTAIGYIGRRMIS